MSEDNIRKLTRLEQLEYMRDFYKSLIVNIELELNKVEKELNNEKNLVKKLNK